MKKWLLKNPPWVHALTVTALICYLTLTPNPLPDNGLKLFPGADLVVHAIMFGTLTLAINFDWLRQHKELKPVTENILALAVILFGAMIELIQARYISGRSGDIFDFIADVAGVIMAASLTPVLKKWMD